MELPSGSVSASANETKAQQLIFVLDVSGSMSGSPITQVRKNRSRTLGVTIL